MGTASDMEFRKANPRQDSISRQRKVKKAQGFVKKGKGVGSVPVEDLLFEDSYVPTSVSQFLLIQFCNPPADTFSLPC